MSHQLNKELFSKNIDALTPRTEELKKFHRGFDEKVKKVLVKTRILLKQKSLLLSLITNLRQKKINQQAIERGKLKLEEEMRETQEISAREIKNLLEEKE